MIFLVGGWNLWTLRVISEIWTPIAIAYLVGGLAGIIIRKSRSLRARWRMPVALAMLAPAGVALVGFIEAVADHEIARMLLAGLALPALLGFPIAGGRLKGNAPLHSLQAPFIILVCLPISLSLAWFGLGLVIERVERWHRAEEARAEQVAAESKAEHAFRDCVKILQTRSGERDAHDNFAKGLRRLYALTRQYQESSDLTVPGIETMAKGFAGPYGYIDGRAKADHGLHSYGVASSPYGALSAHHASARSGAHACEAETLSYAGLYNATMLRLGPLRRPIQQRPAMELPRLWGSDLTHPGLHEHLYRGVSRSEYLAQLVKPITLLGITPGVLTRADIEAETMRTIAQTQAGLQSNILRYDRDGNGIVTGAELENASPLVDAREAARRLTQLDLDRDGSIRPDEVRQVAKSEVESRSYARSAIDELLRHDPNRDGKLTEAELRALGTKVFATVDTDGNGVISKAEYKAKPF